MESLKSYSSFDIVEGATLKNFLAENLVMNYSNIEIKWTIGEGKRWSMPLTVHEKGDWEPRLVTGRKNEALVVFDSYRNGNYDVFLAGVPTKGKHTIIPIAQSARYEARPEAALSSDGKQYTLEATIGGAADARSELSASVAAGKARTRAKATRRFCPCER